MTEMGRRGRHSLWILGGQIDVRRYTGSSIAHEFVFGISCVAIKNTLFAKLSFNCASRQRSIDQCMLPHAKQIVGFNCHRNTIIVKCK